jgi:large subunit ribosomal protein L18
MATGATYSVRFRRKRSQKTDYKKRLNLLKSRQTRLVVRKTNKNIICQLVEYTEDGDRITAHANSQELKKLGWNHSTSNTPSAYLTGLLCGVKGKKKGVQKAILDTGLLPIINGSKIFAAQKGLIDASIECPADDKIFPSGERISGKTIAGYNEKSKDMESDFQNIKEAILKSG